MLVGGQAANCPVVSLFQSLADAMAPAAEVQAENQLVPGAAEHCS